MTPADAWSSGDAYEAYVGRWSRLVAADFVRWLEVGPGKRWLEIGCGTGALTATIARQADPATILAIDASPAYVEAARGRLDDGRVRFEAADATTLDVDDAVDVVVSGLVLNFLPNADAVVKAMIRAVADGGVVAAYVWDYAGRMDLMRCFWDVAVRLDPDARALDEAVRFPMCDPERLTEMWTRAGLESVATTAIDVPTHFTSFDELWSPFLGGQGPAPGYVMSRADADRDALRDACRDELPIAADGSISLVARAWAVRGRRAPRTR